ncbi:MAG TPA: glyceraldehyde-3-phosphate dehydrogenase [Bacteroidia bacterium]|jgi:glyceraldehyde 3-phosphate dehydrogenase|nr:glyceraldehyde-3-phosphate dehydrogenase [Bacteroidia bacterium]
MKDVKEKTQSPSLRNYEAGLKDWIGQEKAAIELINIVGKLWYDRSVELVIFRQQLVDRSSSVILNHHLYAQNIVKQPITIFDTLLLATEISKLEIAPSRIDIGKLSSEWLKGKENYRNGADFISHKLYNFIGKDKRTMIPKDVVLYGFGRIGRIIARELITQAGKGEQLRLRAIVTRSNSNDDISKRAELLRSDSVHGPFPGTVTEDFENKTLIVNGHSILMLAGNKPDEIDYEAYGIKDSLLIDNTGAWRDRAGLSEHLKAKGVGKVLLTAPGKGDIPNIVHGINHTAYNADEKIFSAASCTTNAITPVLSVIDNELGIVKGHVETIHAYTNDQNLLDNYHNKSRRGRSAVLNMVITETGAGKAVTKVLPQLEGKITGNAVRVPVPDVSLAILNLTLKKDTTAEEVNETLRHAALYGNLIEQIQYSSSSELVSSDLIGNSCACVIDSPSTIVSNDKRSVVIYAWYDNEYGYCKQVMRFAKQIADVIRLTYY